MVNFSVPTPICDLPFRVHGRIVDFYVYYADGSFKHVQDRVGSFYLLREALVNRLSRDLSINRVRVRLCEGVTLCECFRS